MFSNVNKTFHTLHLVAVSQRSHSMTIRKEVRKLTITQQDIYRYIHITSCLSIAIVSTLLGISKS